MRAFRPVLVLALVAALLGLGPAPATAAAPPTPTGLRGAPAGEGRVAVTWDAVPGAQRYEVAVTDPATARPTVQTLWRQTFAVVPVTPGAEVQVRVRTISASGRSSYGAPFRIRNTITAAQGSFGVASYNILCADYCVETTRHNMDTFPWLKRRNNIVNTLDRLPNVDLVGLQEAGGYVAVGWNCRTSSTCWRPAKKDPSGKEAAADRWCSATDCPARVPGGRYNGTPRQIDDVMARLPQFGITAIAGDPEARENGMSYLRIMYRKSTFTLVQEGKAVDIDGAAYEKNVEWHRKAYWAVLEHKATGKRYFVVTAHPVSNGGVTKAEGYPSGATGSAVRAASMETLVSRINAANTAKLPVILTGDLNTPRWDDGAMNVLRRAGYIDTRSAYVAKARLNVGVPSSSSFVPRLVSKSEVPALDHVLVKPEPSGKAFQVALSWLLVDVVRTSKGSRIYNCRSMASITATPSRECWGSDHFPLVTQLWR
jgi:hypothetical protein